jgi:hypothetical protein
MHFSDYPSFEYAVRALRLRAHGLTPENIELCTGIPHNLQDELLPVFASGTDIEDIDLHDKARHAVAAMGPEQIAILRAAIEIRRESCAPRSRLKSSQVIAIDLRAAEERALDATRTARGSVSTRFEGLLGKHDAPLPLESSVSVMLRFMRANAFNWAQSRAAVEIDLPKLPGLFGHRAIVVFQPQLNPEKWSDTADQKLAVELPNVAGALLAPNFRFCLSCLDHLYHSVVHQIPFQTRCAIHKDQQLLDSCRHCGAATLTTEAMLMRGYKALVCPSCSFPITGSPLRSFRTPTFAKKLETHAECLEDYISWFSDAQEKLWSLEQLIAQNAGASSWGASWGFSIEAFLSTVQAHHPLPRATAPVRPLLAFPWSIRSSQLQLMSPGRSRSRATDLTANGTYGETLREIASSLRSSGESAPCSYELSLKSLRSNHMINTETASPAILAFQYLRLSLGDNRDFADFEHTHRMEDVDSAQNEQMRGEFQQLSVSVRARLLSYYGVIVNAIKLRGSSGFRRSQLALDFNRSIPVVGLPEQNSASHPLLYEEGVAYSPKIDEFDLRALYSALTGSPRSG